MPRERPRAAIHKTTTLKPTSFAWTDADVDADAGVIRWPLILSVMLSGFRRRVIEGGKVVHTSTGLLKTYKLMKY